MKIGNRRSREPRLADLNQPVVLVRSTRVPDAGEDAVGWVRTLTPYGKAWAKKSPANRVALTMVNADDTSDTVFIIRTRQDLSIEVRDFLLHYDDLYAVNYTREVVGYERSYLGIYCVPFGSLSSTTYEEGDPETRPEVQPDQMQQSTESTYF